MFKKASLALALSVAALAAQASPVTSIGAGTYASAQVLSAGDFSFNSVATVTNSSTQAHVEIAQNQTTSSTGYFYYRFNTSGGLVTLDADSNGVDTELGLWRAATGALLAANDDNNYDGGGYGLDAAIVNFNLAAGDYIVGACHFNCFFAANGVITGTGANGSAFRLNISANQNNVPEPASLALVALALAGVGVAKRKNRTS